MTKQFTNTILSFSTGKDSILALYYLIQNGHKIENAFVTLNSEYKRVNFHSINEKLIDKQASSLNLNIEKIYIDKSETIEEYKLKMTPYFNKIKNNGYKNIAFGDIFLTDLKDFRDNHLKELNMKGVYPLWGKSSKDVMNEFLHLGFKAIITCIDLNNLDKSYLGTILDEQLIASFPKNVDICGENGEYHTFVFDGPIFKNRVNLNIENIYQKDNFIYLNLN